MYWNRKDLRCRRRKPTQITAALTAGVLLLTSTGLLSGCSSKLPDSMEQKFPISEEEHTPNTNPIQSLSRIQLLNFAGAEEAQITPSVPAYTVAPGLTNVMNTDQFYLSDDAVNKLEENLFVVTNSYGHEFFEVYESNRYNLVPNFVTVDSMMHTYHLYFSLLLSRTEKNYLADGLLNLSKGMLESSMAQYDALEGSKWEEAARRNVAFFAVAAVLQDPSVQIPDYAADLAEAEVDRINAAAGIDTCGISETFMDYTQFIPRGYYEGDQVLEQYFRAMMWYGQVNFGQKDEDMSRSALLMNLAMADGNQSDWEMIYTVTSFFAGASDDLSYYDYRPAIETAYGGLPAAVDLPGGDKAFDAFVNAIEAMDPPAINSVPVWDGTEDIQELNKGFRFMGQRFPIDAAIMQKLVYSQVKETAGGDKRMLPDVLDVPAAMGSDLALDLLSQQGATQYPGFTENMDRLRSTIAQAPESAWNASLYSSWLYTLMPLLEEKGEGYPSFMTSQAWQQKSLETFAGSFTELKHDTVLYAKQVMAEMGGDYIEEVDDRGYVEPEPEVFRRFYLLAQQTAEGLDKYGLINDEDKENLFRLAQLAKQLQTISEKELRNETLTDEEYELIRTYGGNLEHFWIEAVKDKAESDYLETQEIPASLVTDIATDPNGTVLQIANAMPQEIVVVVPVDGTLRLASGAVYDFYQFTWPMEQRLTDTQWRQMIGEWVGPDGNYNWEGRDSLVKPTWTESYRSNSW